MNLKTLSQNWKLSAAVLVTLVVFLAILVGQANAISLINEDSVPYEIQVLTQPGADPEDTFLLSGGEMMVEFCEDGCTLVLQNGKPETFSGDEEVFIKDGAFTLSQ